MKLNRIGMILIACALAAITLVVTLLVMRQHDSQAAQIRIKGVGLVKSLSTVPMQVLTNNGGNGGVLGALLAYHDNGDFAYATIGDAGGRILAEVAGRGSMTPSVALPASAATGFGERDLKQHDATPALREFFGPLADRSGGQLFVRVGFYQPRYALPAQDVSFLALLALAMFLVVPVVYLMIKREMTPLAALSDQLRSLARPDKADAADAGEMRDLIADMRGYLNQAGARIVQLEQGALNTTADNRLLQYGSKKLNAALQSLPDGLLMLDPAGDVTFASGKIEPLLGIPTERLLGQPLESWCCDPALRALLGRYSGDLRDNARAGGVGAGSVDFAPINVEGRQLSATAQALSGGHGTMSFGANAWRARLATTSWRTSRTN
jgi:PAS domain-containing protein